MSAVSDFVSSKRVLLSAPGSKINGLYYDEDDTKIQQVTVDQVTGKYQTSLNLAWGSSSQITIPNQNMIGACYIYGELDPIIANQTLCSQWLSSSIRDITFSWGAANISQISLSGTSIQQIFALTGRAKAEAIAELGGQSYIAASTLPVTSVIQVPLPWSVVEYLKGEAKKPYDTSLLANPIQIQVSLYDSDRVFGNVGVAPTNFKALKFFTTEQILADRADSLKMSLMRNPSLLYTYPFVHKQTGSVKYNLPSLQKNVVNIQEFLDGDMTNLVFSVKQMDDQKKGLKAGFPNSPPNPAASMRLTNIKLSLNGSTIYECPGDSARLVAMAQSTEEVGVIADAYTNTGYTQDQISNYVYVIDFAMARQLAFSDTFQNTTRFPSQTMQLEFFINNHLPGDVAVHQCQLESTHFYSAVCETGNGVATIQIA